MPRTNPKYTEIEIPAKSTQNDTCKSSLLPKMRTILNKSLCNKLDIQNEFPFEYCTYPYKDIQNIIVDVLNEHKEKIDNSDDCDYDTIANEHAKNTKDYLCQTNPRYIAAKVKKHTIPIRALFNGCKAQKITEYMENPPSEHKKYFNIAKSKSIPNDIFVTYAKMAIKSNPYTLIYLKTEIIRHLSNIVFSPHMAYTLQYENTDAHRLNIETNLKDATKKLKSFYLPSIYPKQFAKLQHDIQMYKNSLEFMEFHKNYPLLNSESKPLEHPLKNMDTTIDALISMNTRYESLLNKTFNDNTEDQKAFIKKNASLCMPLKIKALKLLKPKTKVKVGAGMRRTAKQRRYNRVSRRR